MKIGFIGAGNMGGAILNGIVNGGKAQKSDITVLVRSDESKQKYRTNGIAVAKDTDELLKNSDVIFIAVKPKDVAGALSAVNTDNAGGKLFVSMVAGADTGFISSLLPANCSVMCIMPNTPAIVGQGITVVYTDYTCTDEAADGVCSLLTACGRVEKLSPCLSSAVVGVSGSGPAYTYLFIDALAYAGMRLGLSRRQAVLLAAQTVKGSAEMVLESGKSPADLKDEVSSPAGTTVEAVALLKRAGFEGIVIDAATACAQKAAGIKK